MAKFFLILFSLLLTFSIGVFVVDQVSPQIDFKALLKQLIAERAVEVKTQTDVATTEDSTTDVDPDSDEEQDSDKLTFAEMLAQEEAGKKTAAPKKTTIPSKKVAEPQKAKAQPESKKPEKTVAKKSETPSAKKTAPKTVNKPAPAPKAAAPSVAKPSGWCIQIGAFRTHEEAERMTADLEKNRYPHFIYQTEINGHQWYRVNIGPFESPGAAATFKQSRSIGQKFKGAFVKKL